MFAVAVDETSLVEQTSAPEALKQFLRDFHRQSLSYPAARGPVEASG